MAKPASIDRSINPDAAVDRYWNADADALLQRLGSTRDGLTATEAARRLREHGPNQVRERSHLTRTRAFLTQIRNPLLLVLVFAAVASATTGEWVDAAIVLVIVLATVGIGYVREYTAAAAAAALQTRVLARTRVLRDGHPDVVSVEDVVPGDVALLSAGSLVPADGVILEASDCFVSESVLTGESFPVEKRPGPVVATAALRDRLNCGVVVRAVSLARVFRRFASALASPLLALVLRRWRRPGTVGGQSDEQDHSVYSHRHDSGRGGDASCCTGPRCHGAAVQGAR